MLERNASLEEQEFLKNYDDSKYEKPSVTTDMAIFSIFDEDTENYRKLPKRILRILLIKRGVHPFKDCYALPGGFVQPYETMEEAANRELLEETGVSCNFMEQLRTFSNPGRDPRRWVITGSYLALIDGTRQQVKAGDDAKEAKWFDISMKKSEDGMWCLELTHGSERLSAILADKSTTWDVYPRIEVVDNNGIAFDHALIIAHAILQLRKWIRQTGIAFRLLPEKFTLTQLQQVYEAVLETRLLTPAFRRKMEEFVEATDEMTGEEGHRPAKLFVEKKRE